MICGTDRTRIACYGLEPHGGARNGAEKEFVR
jgi:hypothetical protein